MKIFAIGPIPLLAGWLSLRVQGGGAPARFEEAGEDWSYLEIGSVFGIAAAVLTFVAAYIYCIAAYGFLLGFGFGWLPSALLAVAVAGAVRFLWGPILVLLTVGGVLIFRAAG